MRNSPSELALTRASSRRTVRQRKSKADSQHPTLLLSLLSTGNHCTALTAHVCLKEKQREMGSQNLSAGFALTDARIDETVRRASPGVYVLDRTTTGPFTVHYAGRSDTDLNARLHQWAETKYKFFKAHYCS